MMKIDMIWLESELLRMAALTRPSRFILVALLQKLAYHSTMTLQDTARTNSFTVGVPKIPNALKWIAHA